MDRPWKVFERQIAAKMGTTRALNHLAGGGDKSDVDHPIFSIDCKLKKTFSLNDFRELRSNARAHNKIPVMAYRRPAERLTYCVLEFDTFVSLAREAGWIDTEAVDGDISEWVNVHKGSRKPYRESSGRDQWDYGSYGVR